MARASFSLLSQNRAGCPRNDEMSMRRPRLLKVSAGALYNEISERVFTAHIIQLARRRGWLCAHFRPGLTQRGRWVTAMSGDVGFPDIVLARGTQVIFAELKTKNGKTSPAQDRWLETLRGSPYVGAVVWRPSDIADIEMILK